jgi:NHLM bacteriocin system ABC transporter ATP-binding protein
VLNSILTGIFSLCSLGLMFYYNWRLAMLGLTLVMFALAVSTSMAFWQVRTHRDITYLKGKVAGLVSQLIGGVAKLRVAGAEGRAYCLWARDFARQRELAVEARRGANQFTVFVAFFPILCQAALFYYYANMLADPQIIKDPPYTTGDFLACMAAFGQFLAAALMVNGSVISALGIVPLFERAQPIFAALPEVTEARTSPGKLTGLIELSNITFRYKPDQPLVLRGVSLRIEPGEFVAFVGASGSGKSTIFRLLLGFEQAEAGAVYFDAKDLNGLDVQAVRRQMGVVLQNSRLASGDIFSNIIGSAPLTLRDAWDAAAMAGLDEDIKAMPMGIHTVVSEGGGTLSGGQRQRLLIARAIVNRPRIILFDEATSALDNQTQAIVSRSLESLQATRIVIAHRLSTVINADRIYVLDKGQIVQSGTYASLAEQPGIFRDLATRQTA